MGSVQNLNLKSNTIESNFETSDVILEDSFFDDDVSLQYQGFTPSPYTREYLPRVMEQLREEAPSKSSIRATICRVPGRQRTLYRGIIRVQSPQGRFFAIASVASVVSASAIHELGQLLLSRIRKQLGRWKTRRFQGSEVKLEPLKIPS